MREYRETDHEDQAGKERFHRDATRALKELGKTLTQALKGGGQKYSVKVESNKAGSAMFGDVRMTVGNLCVWAQGDFSKVNGSWQVMYRQEKPRVGSNQWTTLVDLPHCVPAMLQILQGE